MSVEERGDRKVVVKRNKLTKGFHEFIVVFTYSLISFLLGHPSRPVALTAIMANEGYEMRRLLSEIGVGTPELISISDSDLVEEYVEGGDVYSALASGSSTGLAIMAGSVTARMHAAGYSFVDNKAQNYLVKDRNLVIRTDLGFTKKSSSLYSRSMDIGSFLASVMDLPRYSSVERAFYEGYKSVSNRKFSYLSIIIRNVLSIGFSSSSIITLRNMMLDSRSFLDA